MSFPDQEINTVRYNEIVVEDFLHPSGIILTGLDAVVAQHEVGHLCGEIMFDYEVTIPSGPNMKCYCNSGKKYKKCHMGKIIKV